MKDAYSNVAGPPRTRVRRDVRPVGKQIVFAVQNCDIGLLYSLDYVKEFARQHKTELDAVPRPTGFMVATRWNKNNCKTMEDFVQAHPDFYQVCTDPILTLAILGRVAGSIYVPHRELQLTKDSLFPMSFPAKYFPQFGGAS